MSLTDNLKHAWNAFLGRDPTSHTTTYYGDGGTWYRQDKTFYSQNNERTIISTIYNRIALDVASNKILHVQCDQNGNFESEIDSHLNECLTLSANIDQIGRDFIKDAIYSLCEEGVIALVPTDTTINPDIGSFDILEMRVGQIIDWYPKHIRIKVYNENTGRKEEIIAPKETIAIINNPFYEVMNAPNSTLKRLVNKMALLDMTDKNNATGKLDMIIKLPYKIKTESQRRLANERRKDIEDQLVGSKYGIAYADSTENIIQLNRPIENNLYDQVKDLKAELFTELGLTEGILNGTASEQELLNYQQNTIKHFLEVMCIEMKRKFLSKNARTRGQSIMYFNNPFGIVPVSQIAEIADKFTRNEIMSSNEFRSVIGYKPVKDPRADELRNKNLNASNDQLESPISTEQIEEDEPQVSSEEPKIF